MKDNKGMKTMDNIIKVGAFWWMIGLVFMLMGCDHKAEILLERAEAFLPAEPDSAEVCLNSIEEPARLGDAPRALYGLLRTYVDNRQGKEVKSDSLIRDSYEYYREVSHAGQTFDQTLMRHYAQSCYYLALYYSFCDSTKQCEDLLHQSIKYSEKCEDWHTCYLAYTQLGRVAIWGNSEYAIQQSLKALDVYHKINDDVNNEVLILGKIATKYLCSAQPDSALRYFYMGEKLAKKNHLIQSQNDMYMGMADTYLYMGEYENALDCAKKGIATADSTVLVPSLLTLAQCYHSCDSLENAKDILETIRHDANSTNKYFIYRDLSQLAIQTQDLDSLSAYTDSAYECLEDRFLQSQREKDEYYQDNLLKKLEKEKIQHEAERNKWVLGFIIICLVSLSLYIYNVLRKKKRVIAEHKKEIRHQQELLHQKSMTHAVLQKHFMEKLEYSRKLMADGEKAHMRKEDWNEMEHLIDDTDNNFVQKLRRQYKGLKEEDVRLCMLVRLKMTNATIANVFYIGESAVKKRKSVLKKIGFQVLDSNITLDQVIENL